MSNLNSKTKGKIVLIGGSQSNVGKTTLIRFILREYPKMFIALKVTNNERHGIGFSEETPSSSIPNKDTYFFLENAKKVFWARGGLEYLTENLPKYIEKITDPIIVEGNVFFDIVKPDLFFFVERVGFEIKESAKKYRASANYIVLNGDYSFKLENNFVYVNLNRLLTNEDKEFRNFINTKIREVILP